MGNPYRFCAVYLVFVYLCTTIHPLFGQQKNITPAGQGGIILPGMSGLDRNSGTSFGMKEKLEQGPLQLPGLSGGGSSSAWSGLNYQVHVLGEVQNPGVFRVIPSIRLSEVLDMAGGLLERGSERNVEIRRSGGKEKRYDLLSYKLLGNLDANPYLLDNDVVFVPLRQKVIQVAGAVKRPGVYELTSEESLQEVVELAGGFTPGVGNPVPIKVVRYEGTKKEVMEVPNLEPSRRDFQVKTADVVVVPHILTEDKKFDYNLPQLPGDNALFYPSFEERVFVVGAVPNPGPYPYSLYFDVRQYLTMAGGTTKLAKRVSRWRLISSTGEKQRAGFDTKVNPGDTIIIPEKYLPPESILSLVLGLTASTLGITTTVLTLAR